MGSTQAVAIKAKIQGVHSCMHSSPAAAHSTARTARQHTGGVIDNPKHHSQTNAHTHAARSRCTFALCVVAYLMSNLQTGQGTQPHLAGAVPGGSPAGCRGGSVVLTPQRRAASAHSGTHDSTGRGQPPSLMVRPCPWLQTGCCLRFTSHIPRPGTWQLVIAGGMHACVPCRRCWVPAEEEITPARPLPAGPLSLPLPYAGPAERSAVPAPQTLWVRPGTPLKQSCWL